MTCTRCQQSIVKGQKYYRTKRGSHHETCPNYNLDAQTRNNMSRMDSDEVRDLMGSMPHKNFYKADRYDTDVSHVLHVWDDETGHSWDLRIAKESTFRAVQELVNQQCSCTQSSGDNPDCIIHPSIRTSCGICSGTGGHLRDSSGGTKGERT